MVVITLSHTTRAECLIPASTKPMCPPHPTPTPTHPRQKKRFNTSKLNDIKLQKCKWKMYINQSDILQENQHTLQKSRLLYSIALTRVLTCCVQRVSDSGPLASGCVWAGSDSVVVGSVIILLKLQDEKAAPDFPPSQAFAIECEPALASVPQAPTSQDTP